MKKIAKIADKIMDTIREAEDNALFAIEYKALDRPLADAAWTIASQLLGHVDIWHAQEVRMIKDEQAKGKEPPAGMMMVYEFQHKREMDAVARVKIMLDEYKK